MPGFAVARAARVDLLERQFAEGSSSAFALALRAFEIVTLRLTPEFD